MGPRAPETPKLYGILLILSGMAHPGRAGTQNWIFADSAKTCVQFWCKGWIPHKILNFHKFYHFPHVRTLAQTCCFLVLFKVSRPVSKKHTYNAKNMRKSIFLNVPGPESALCGPEFDFLGPCVKPFINTPFWEVFWRPRTRNVHFLSKIWKIRPKEEDHQKHFCCKYRHLRERAGNLPTSGVPGYAWPKGSQWIPIFAGKLLNNGKHVYSAVFTRTSCSFETGKHYKSMEVKQFFGFQKNIMFFWNVKACKTEMESGNPWLPEKQRVLSKWQTLPSNRVRPIIHAPREHNVLLQRKNS